MLKTDTIYSVKEFQMVVRDAVSLPAEIEPFVGQQFRSPATAAQILGGLEVLPAEVFIVLHLNAKHIFVGMHVASMGSMTETIAHPREVFRPAVANLTASIILAHNHPSGETRPSSADLRITERLAKAGEILGIRVLDHIIIGRDGAFKSLADLGLL